MRPMRPRRPARTAWLATPLLLLAVGACSSPTASEPAAAGGSAASQQPAAAPLLAPIDASPRQEASAAIEVAFDMQAADALVTDLPAGFDFSASALLCVYLGERPTTGWSLALQGATLEQGELRVRAREMRPGGGTQAQTTYPAACGALDRAVLPPGELPVRADDTISEEFITDGTVVVPAPAGAP